MPAERSGALENEAVDPGIRSAVSQVWVKAGQCNEETSIEARRTDMTHVAIEFVTTCEHIQKLAEVLKSLDIGREMSVNLLDTEVYRLANEHVCRNSCIVPAAILKVLEVEANIFPAAESQIVFVA